MAATTSSLASESARDLRAKILREAAKLFAERGFGATSMREVAAACGCTKPALYYYFDSKQNLFRAVVEAEIDFTTALIQDGLHAEGQLRETLEASLTRYFDHVRDNPVAMAVLMRASGRAEPGQPDIDVAGARMRHIELTNQVLERARARGELRPDIQLEDAGFLISCFVESACARHVFEGEPLDEERTMRVLDLFFNGVAPR